MSADEWWDVTDAEGMATGETYRRGAPDWPSGGFHVIAATCVYRHDGAVLLTQRAATKEFPLGWEFPGGSALAGESSTAAASRELYEETGLETSPDALMRVGRFTETSALLDFYVAPAPNMANLVLDPTEVVAAVWVSVAEVDRRLRSGVMAAPWAARLDALWTPALRAIESTR